MKILLTQPSRRSGDMCQDIEELIRDESTPDCDIAVLPELIGSTSPTKIYEEQIMALAKRWQCHVVGGSHYLPLERGLVNAGIVCNREGQIVTRYEKVRPYGSELGRGVVRGSTSGSFELDGRKIMILICSDIWFSDSFFDLDGAPDVILIPSFSVTQKSNPDSARQLWKHMLISRAYEYAAYVGVSDWAHPCEFDGLSAAGVTGLANPRPSGDCYHIAQSKKFSVYELDFTRLDAFRQNRAVRGFLWKKRSS